MSKTNRAIKYRIYPTKEQKVMFAKTFGCCRKVWNLMLADKIDSYKNTGKFIKTTPAQYKADYPYLREVDSLALANVQINLQNAFSNHFSKTRKKRNRFPKFKSAKLSRKSYTTNNQHGTVAIVDGRYIKLPKVGTVKAVIHRAVFESWILKSATISMEPDGSYYVSVLYEYTEDIKPAVGNKAVGLDYKSDGLYASSEGEVCGMPHYYRKNQPRLAKEQRKLKHKKKGSANWKKQQKRIAKVYKKIANRRKDFLHKKSTEIANQYDIVCVEELDMKAMSNKGFGNGKATLDNGYGMFLGMLEYKLRDRGKTFVRIDKWYPSSQVCSSCGARQSIPLNERVYNCPHCGMVLDRDLNAARNIKSEGLRLIA